MVPWGFHGDFLEMKDLFQDLLLIKIMCLEKPTEGLIPYP